MEDKENTDERTWNQLDTAVEKGFASPKALKSPGILKQSTRTTNCSPLPYCTSVASEIKPAEMKNPRMSFSQTFLLQKNTKEKQLKTATHNSGAHLPEGRVLGSYRGKVVSSKINSFRKKSENADAKNSSTAPPKPAMRTGSTNSSADTKNTKITKVVSASKPVVVASLQVRPPVRISVSHTKPILNHEKRSVNSISMNKVAVQRKPDRNQTPLLKTVLHNANKTAPGAKKTVQRKTVTGTSLGQVSETRAAVSVLTSKSVGNRKSTLPESADVRRTQLAEWQASKVKEVKKPPTSICANTQPERETLHQTVKEPVESFWAAIAEEDEQELVSDAVNKTLAECLHLIEKGSPGDKIRSTLEKLILDVPDAKKLAKYWVCCMRLEQRNSNEKIIAVYEEAVLTGAQPKDELRHALADIMKITKELTKSNGESMKKEITASHKAKADLVEEPETNAIEEVHLNKMMEPSIEEPSQKAAEACLKSEQESFPNESKHKNTKQIQEKVCEKEQSGHKAERKEILAFKTPENDKTGSYLIKYNVSTTPYLESVKKKMQCEATDSAVKDLKFLTPVRRSRRLQDKVCKLPNMLKDHNPCVHSLDQLGKLGDETSAYIYRQNTVLHNGCANLEGQNKE